MLEKMLHITAGYFLSNVNYMARGISFMHFCRTSFENDNPISSIFGACFNSNCLFYAQS